MPKSAGFPPGPRQLLPPRGGTALVESLAIDSFRIKLIVFVLAALLAGISGWFFAHMQRYVGPMQFNIDASIELLLMALVGGASQIAGAVVGSAVVTLIRNFLQDVLPSLTTYSGQLEGVVFGILFVILLQKARGGIVPIVRKYLPRPQQKALPGRGGNAAAAPRPRGGAGASGADD